MEKITTRIEYVTIKEETFEIRYSITNNIIDNTISFIGNDYNTIVTYDQSLNKFKCETPFQSIDELEDIISVFRDQINTINGSI